MQTIEFNGNQLIIKLPNGTILDIAANSSGLYVDHRDDIGEESNNCLHIPKEFYFPKPIEAGTYFFHGDLNYCKDSDQIRSLIWKNKHYDFLSVDCDPDMYEGYIRALRNHPSPVEYITLVTVGHDGTVCHEVI